MNDINELNDITNKLLSGPLEKTGTCPVCNEEINIFVNEHDVGCFCKHCGYATSTPTSRVNPDALKEE